MTYFFEPPEKWANLADCGDFPCTGPKNTIFSFTNIKWTGLQGENALEDFTLIPTIPGYTTISQIAKRLTELTVIYAQIMTLVFSFGRVWIQIQLIDQSNQSTSTTTKRKINKTS
jgi:hypothetical protein